MVSPELLRRYSFFGRLDDAQLKSIAMIAEEQPLESETTLFQEGQPADVLYFLLDGCVDLYYMAEGISLQPFPRGIPVGEINPGEPFGISALIEPHVLTSSAYVSKPSRVLKIEAPALRELFEKDRRLAYQLTRQAAKAAIGRLHSTRIQLAAAWA